MIMCGEGICKSRPSESISSRRELQNLTSGLGSRYSPRRPWFGVERLSLAQARESRLSEIMCNCGCLKLAQARRTSLSEVEGLAWIVYACGVMFGLEGLSPIGVLDVLVDWTHDGHGIGEESVGQDYERDRLVGEGICKSRPSESISSRRELQNLTSGLGSRYSPRRPWFGVERLSLAQEVQWSVRVVARTARFRMIALFSGF
ncbi:hypothetical protein DEO72_LG3g1501 [Vigna unguiculata]|uniref:Uncharacterized protein n=1 Tax=Vigna unguiculata TaxID=3917 RepID=A0A4D6LEQ5_VIGUN|nr:hypothetical protein DEO72_LG3g1501 [Vigna unguiculata]